MVRKLVAFETVCSLYQGRTDMSRSKKDTVGTGTNCQDYGNKQFLRILEILNHNINIFDFCGGGRVARGRQGRTNFRGSR